MITKTIAATALAALALPAGAQAAKPEKPAKAAKSSSTKAQSVGFTAAGTAAAVPAANATSFTLDLVRANKHALAALGVARADLAKADQTSVADAVAGFRLVFEDGVTAETFNAATDRVKVIGKVQRTRTKGAPKASRFSYGAIDVRKVVISRS